MTSQADLPDLEIALLADHPGAVGPLRKLFETEWSPWYGPQGPGDARADLLASSRRERLPIALVAMRGDRVCGTAALKMASVSTYPELFPWLAALIVEPRSRQQGIASRLIAGVEALAIERGFSEIYVGAGERSGLSEAILAARHWKFLSRGAYYVSEARIYRKELRAAG